MKPELIAGKVIERMKPGKEKDALLFQLAQYYLEQNDPHKAVDCAEQISVYEKKEEMFARIIWYTAMCYNDQLAIQRIIRQVPRKEMKYLRVAVFDVFRQRVGKKDWGLVAYNIALYEKLSQKNREWFLEASAPYVDEAIWKSFKFALRLNCLLVKTKK